MNHSQGAASLEGHVGALYTKSDSSVSAADFHVGARLKSGWLNLQKPTAGILEGQINVMMDSDQHVVGPFSARSTVHQCG